MCDCPSHPYNCHGHPNTCGCSDEVRDMKTKQERDLHQMEALMRQYPMQAFDLRLTRTETLCLIAVKHGYRTTKAIGTKVFKCQQILSINLLTLVKKGVLYRTDRCCIQGIGHHYYINPPPR